MAQYYWQGVFNQRLFSGNKDTIVHVVGQQQQKVVSKSIQKVILSLENYKLCLFYFACRCFLSYHARVHDLFH
jgi:hypothetical protein